MPNPSIVTFAKKSGKPEAEIEKMWKDVKASLIKQGDDESSESFYPKLVGIIKKNLKLESVDAIEDSLFATFLKEKDIPKDDKTKNIKMSIDKGKDNDDPEKKAQDDEDDDDLSTLDGDYNSIEMLHAIIEAIRGLDDPDGDAGEEGEIDYGLEILYEVAEQIPEETLEIIIDALFQFYDIDDEDVEDAMDGADGEDETDEAMNEALIGEAMSAIKKKRMYYLKKKRKKQLGKRSGSMQFKRNYKFDTKKGRYTKRKKPQSVSSMRKKARRITKMNKRSSNKIKAKRTKKRVAHVKDPYGGSKRK